MHWRSTAYFKIALLTSLLGSAEGFKIDGATVECLYVAGYSIQGNVKAANILIIGDRYH